MSKPQGGPTDAGKPQIHDEAPPRSTGVPIERDPVSGRLLSGDPLGRGDKGRSARAPGRTALITAGAIAVASGEVVAVVLVTGGNDELDPSAAAGARTTEQTTTSAAPTTTTPAVETGPRDIPITLTISKITPAPGFGQDPAFGTVGQVLPRIWTLTGACDGSGPCDVQHCRGPGDCIYSFSGQPQGNGSYVGQFTNPITWQDAECSGGTLDIVLTWTFSGEGDDLTVSGTWVESASELLFTGSDGRTCGVYLAEYAIASR